MGRGVWVLGCPGPRDESDPKSTYNIAKGKGLDVADANGNGSVDLKSEMTFARLLRSPTPIRAERQNIYIPSHKRSSTDAS